MAGCTSVPTTAGYTHSDSTNARQLTPIVREARIGVTQALGRAPWPVIVAPISIAPPSVVSPRPRQTVNLSALSFIRNLPLRTDPSLRLQPVQRRIERSRLNLQHILRRALDIFRNRMSVRRTNAERLKNQQIERLLKNRALE